MKFVFAEKEYKCGAGSQKLAANVKVLKQWVLNELITY